MANDQIERLAEFSSDLIDFDFNGNPVSRVIENEFNVRILLNHNVLLIGKIDLVARKGEGLLLIELKTGNPNQKTDSNQLRIYNKILKKTYADIPIELELWNTKPGDFKKFFSKKTSLRLSSKNLLLSIEKNISSSAKVKKSSDLPPNMIPILIIYVNIVTIVILFT